MVEEIQDSLSVAADTIAAVAAVVIETVPAAEVAAEESTVSIGLFTANNVWMMICTALVFIMHLGFATLETGLTRAKNTVNILFKNVMTPSIGLLTYYICGFNMMYPGDFNIIGDGIMGFAGFGIAAPENGMTVDYASGGYTWWTDFIFQGMFAATCATIVSGCVAERIKLESYLIFTILFVAILYPVTGSWKWGGGFLDAMGFYDFAGSTLVHSVGGWGGLAGILVLGPRVGKYVDGKTKALHGHNMPLATIGVFLLWLGWFGFNGGSVLSADPALTSLVLVTTSLAAASGAISSMFVSFFISKKHDLTMVLNGVLGGLVGITAGADQMSPGDSIWIGAIAGVIVVLAVIFFDKIKIDDPVGALSVHLVCGIFGTLAVGMFGAMAGMEQLQIQAYGVMVYGITTFIFAYVVFFILNKTMGIRVSKDHEISGLDINEHGMIAYSELNDEL